MTSDPRGPRSGRLVSVQAGLGFRPGLWRTVVRPVAGLQQVQGIQQGGGTPASGSEAARTCSRTARSRGATLPASSGLTRARLSSPTLKPGRRRMALQQSIELALAAYVGGSGLPQTAIDAALSVVENAAKRLREDDASGRLPLLHMPRTTEDLDEIRTAADRLKQGATDVVFLGTGGSSLGGQTLAQLADYAVPGLGCFAQEPRVHFLDNLDPMTFGGLLERLPLESSRFVATSKSGGTGETLMQTISVLSALDRAGLRERAGDLLLGLSEPRKAGGRDALRDLLEPEGVRFLDHHTGIGGRYSVLTNVGLLPAAVLGLDIAAIRAGAEDAYAPIRAEASPSEAPAALGASLATAAAMEGKAITVLMAYADRLERLTRWWVQLWAESLGKDGKGTQPVAAIGPVDQHSQQQPYLAGPKDKLFTLVTVD